MNKTDRKVDLSNSHYKKALSKCRITCVRNQNAYALEFNSNEDECFTKKIKLFCQLNWQLIGTIFRVFGA